MAKESKARRCPVCGKPQAAAHAPFCSTACADTDLNRWLGGNYRIPTQERPEGGIPPQKPDEE